MNEKRIDRLLAKGNCRTALEEVERALAVKPQDLDALLAKSRIILLLAENAVAEEEKKTYFAQAEQDLLRLAELGGEAAKRARMGLLLVYLNSKQYEKAVDHGGIVMKSEEDLAAARYLYSCALFYRNPDRNGAVQALHWIEDESLFPRDMRLDISELKCRAYIALGLYDEAEAEADNLLRHGAFDAERYKATVLAEKGLITEALPYVDKLYKRYPNDMEIKKLRTEALFCNEQYLPAKLACEEMEALGQADERVEEIKTGCAFFLASTEQEYENALKGLTNAIERNPQNIYYRRLRGQCHTVMQRYEEAETDYIAAEALSERFDGDWEYNRAMLCCHQKDWDGAKVRLHRILEENGDSGDVYAQLGRIALLSGKSRQEMEDGLLYMSKAWVCCTNGEWFANAIAGLICTLHRPNELRAFLVALKKRKPAKGLYAGLTGDYFVEISDFANAAKWYAKAVKAGYDYRYQARYYAMYDRKNATKNKEAFWSLLLAEADREEVGAMRFLAYSYAFGWNGCMRNPEEAFALAKKAAADEGYRCAQSLLGRLYLLGIGTERNVKTAVTYFEKASEGFGYNTCCCANGLLAHCFIQGLGLAADEKRATEIILEAESNFGKYMHENAIQLYAWFALKGTAGFELKRAYEYLRFSRSTGLENASVIKMLLLVLQALHLDKDYALYQGRYAAELHCSDTYTQEYMELHNDDSVFYPAMSNQ